jgi:hypothetical protein
MLACRHCVHQSRSPQYAASPCNCCTDDGYGRKRSCSANLKKKPKKKAE